MLETFGAKVAALNDWVATTRLGRYFRLEGCGHPGERKGSRFTTEIRAGLTTYAAMAYILAVNASILSDSGGPCVCEATDGDPICTNNAAYAACKELVRRDLITATAAISCLSSFLMGSMANLPVGMAPGLGLNAYFAYSVVGFNGSGRVTYQQALGAVFLEGWLFFALSILGVRQWLARTMPRSLTLAIGAGIGLFVALVGLGPGGLDVIGGNYTNLLGLGGCKPEDQDPDHTSFCTARVLQSPTMWVGIFAGGIFTVLLMMYRVRGAILLGVLLVSITAWPRGTSVTLFPHTASGDSAFDFFKQVVTFHPLNLIGNIADYHYSDGQVWIALISFLYVDLCDTTGTLYAMARFSGVMDEETGDFENSTWAYCVDGFCISMGSLMGVSPTTAYIESSTGIAEGGKTGLTAITISFAFFVSIFFAPIFASIPAWATGSALVIAGSFMIKSVLEIDWDYVGNAIPAFLTLIMIPYSYNIAYGLITGLLTYIILAAVVKAVAVASGGRVVPPGYHERKEKWEMPPGGLAPLWMRKAASGDPRFWAPDGRPSAAAAAPKRRPASRLDSARSMEEGKGKGEGEGDGDVAVAVMATRPDPK